MVPSMGLLNTLAILQAWLGEHDLRDVPESKIAWIFSCYAFFLYFCGAQVGTFLPLILTPSDTNLHTIYRPNL